MDMHSKYLISILAVIVLFAVGYYLIPSASDPYDPLMGPRNPREAAAHYLRARSDIADVEKSALLDSKPCSVDVLSMLIDSPAREVRSLVAINPSVTESISRKLSSDPDTGVRQYVASNIHTSFAVLSLLRSDTNENVRWSLEHNPAWLSASSTVITK